MERVAAVRSRRKIGRTGTSPFSVALNQRRDDRSRATPTDRNRHCQRVCACGEAGDGAQVRWGLGNRFRGSREGSDGEDIAVVESNSLDKNNDIVGEGHRLAKSKGVDDVFSVRFFVAGAEVVAESASGLGAVSGFTAGAHALAMTIAISGIRA